MLEQPPYLPDLASFDYFLFPKLESIIKETHFPNMNAIRSAVTKELKGILQESLQKSIDAWRKREEKCIRLKGHYFKGNNS